MGAVKKFWDWFVKNQTRVAAFQSGDEALLDDIMAALHAYNHELYFEFSVTTRPMELIITAEGNQHNFQSVIDLIDAAPDIEGWRFIAFKQAQGKGFVTEYEGVIYNPEHLWFRPLFNPDLPDKLALEVFIPQYNEDQNKDAGSAIYVILDTLIGERKVMEHIQFVKPLAMDDTTEKSELTELSELPEFLEQFVE